MRNSIKVYFDGKEYLILDSSGNYWGNGATLDEAYIDFKSKRSNDSTSISDISLMWMRYRNKIIVILAVFALVYAQAAVFLGIPSYLYAQLGNTFADRVVFVTGKITDKINMISVSDKEKIDASLIRLDSALSKFQVVGNSESTTKEKK